MVKCSLGTMATALYTTLMTTLHSLQLDEEYLKDHLIGITTDGTSVMNGVDNGVVSQLKRDYPRVKAIHYVAHKLELAVKEAVASTNHSEVFITKLYTLYHQSHKNQRELEIAAASVQETLRNITPIFTIRWVATCK